ncbi:hypothetical protein D3C83_186310 [compost metagenome]
MRLPAEPTEFKTFIDTLPSGVVAEMLNSYGSLSENVPPDRIDSTAVKYVSAIPPMSVMNT